MDGHELPRVSERWSFLYLDRARIERDEGSVAALQEDRKTPVPVANLAALLLGPGTSVSHAAVRRIADAGCCIVWTGEQAVRFYASITPRSTAELLYAQARAWADLAARHEIAATLFERRFGRKPQAADLPQLLAEEGAAMKAAYQELSENYGIEEFRRDTDRPWKEQDAPNRALSVMSSCLYGVCEAATAALGLCPGLGFLHSGDPRSFVFDAADQYRLEYADLAWSVLSSNPANLETSIRRAIRDAFAERKQVQRTLSDLAELLEPWK